MGVGGQRHAPATTPRKDLEPIVWEVGWDTGTVWTGAKNLANTGIQSLDHAVRSESLYRLSYGKTKQLRNKGAKKPGLS